MTTKGIHASAMYTNYHDTAKVHVHSYPGLGELFVVITFSKLRGLPHRRRAATNVRAITLMTTSLHVVILRNSNNAPQEKFPRVCWYFLQKSGDTEHNRVV